MARAGGDGEPQEIVKIGAWGWMDLCVGPWRRGPRLHGRVWTTRDHASVCAFRAFGDAFEGAKRRK